MATRPDDLVPVRDAARLVDRGYSTVRAWIADGALTAWKGEGTHPGNAPTLVSRAELFAVAGASKSTRPGRHPPAPAEAPPTVAVELAELRAAVAELRAELDRARGAADVARAERDGARETLAEVRARVTDLSAALEAERARARGAEAERDALRSSAGLPWWRRLLGAPPTLPPGDG